MFVFIYKWLKHAVFRTDQETLRETKKRLFVEFLLAMFRVLVPSLAWQLVVSHKERSFEGKGRVLRTHTSV